MISEFTDTTDTDDDISALESEIDGIAYGGLDDIDADALWTLEQKADRLLCRLPAETIGYLGDDFPWAVDDEDVRIARLAFDGVRLGAILLGRELTRITDTIERTLVA